MPFHSPARTTQLLSPALVFCETLKSLGDRKVVNDGVQRAFAALAEGRAPRPGDLAAVNAEWKAAMSRSQIEGDHSGYAVQWGKDSADLSSPLWLVVKSAADLVLSDRRQLVRRCAAPDCDWLFVDNSSNRRRRWCDMKTCGNRAKARRHYRATRTRKW